MSIELVQVIPLGRTPGGQLAPIGIQGLAGVISAGMVNISGDLIYDAPKDNDTPTADENLPVVSYMEGFNGTNFDRWRANNNQTVLASAARTASVDSADLTNYNNRGVHVVINVSALAATPSITPTIQGKDSISGNYYDILVGTAITTTGINILKVYPGIGQVVNGAASDILPRIWRVSMAHADADSITYSVSANLVV